MAKIYVQQPFKHLNANMKTLLKIIAIILLLLMAFVAYQYLSLFIKPSEIISNKQVIITNTMAIAKIKSHSKILKNYAAKHGYNTNFCFLIDMGLPCGKNRFFVYDLQHDSLKYAGLVAHGSGNKAFVMKVDFSNTVSSGLTSLGKYKISYQYTGRFGSAYKLNGLDTSNSNAFERNVVLHAYGCVPDNEPYPLPICNSLGCIMVSYHFLEKLGKEITKTKQPILMWVYE